MAVALMAALGTAVGFGGALVGLPMAARVGLIVIGMGVVTAWLRREPRT